jgi:hypothetical protein
VAVELVVPGDVEHWTDALPPPGPLDAAGPDADVPGQHDHVGIDGDRLERLLFEVQVAEHVQAHRHIMNTAAPGPDP